MTEQADQQRQASQRSVLRSASVMTVMTLLSRVLGLVREQVRALYLGGGHDMGLDHPHAPPEDRTDDRQQRGCQEGQA